MNDELDKLRPEVREALADFDSLMGAFEYAEGELPRDRFGTIRAELLRLADSNATLDQALSKHVFRCTELQLRTEKAEGELAALKAKIAESPIGMVMGGAEGNQDNTDSYRVDVPIGWESSLADRRVRLVVEE